MASTTPITVNKLQQVWSLCWAKEDVKTAITEAKQGLRSQYDNQDDFALNSFLEANKLINKYDLPAPLIIVMVRFFLDDNFDPSDEGEVKKMIPSMVFGLSFIDEIRIAQDFFGTSHEGYKVQVINPSKDLGIDKTTLKKVMMNIFGDGIAIAIPPFAKQQDVLDFINNHWKKDMEPLLGKERQGFMRNPGKLREKTISSKPYTVKQRNERIKHLRETEKLSYDKIWDKLADEGYGYIDSSNLRKIYSRLKNKDL